MENQADFPKELLLDELNRGTRLVREFYAQYHETTDYSGLGHQHRKIKAEFFRKRLEALGHDRGSLGLETGCRRRSDDQSRRPARLGGGGPR